MSNIRRTGRNSLVKFANNAYARALRLGQYKHRVIPSKKHKADKMACRLFKPFNRKED